jgi:hypothetical protein
MNKWLLYIIFASLFILPGCTTDDLADRYSNSMHNLEMSYHSGQISEAEYLQRRQELNSIAIMAIQSGYAREQAIANSVSHSIQYEPTIRYGYPPTYRQERYEIRDQNQELIGTMTGQ